jgi:hypothetical protein
VDGILDLSKPYNMANKEEIRVDDSVIEEASEKPVEPVPKKKTKKVVEK